MTKNDFLVETLFGAKTRQPLVRISYDIEIAVVSPEDAIAVAMNLLQSSQASLTDAFLMSFMEKHVGVGILEAAVVMAEFRLWRQGREIPE